MRNIAGYSPCSVSMKRHYETLIQSWNNSCRNEEFE